MDKYYVHISPKAKAMLDNHIDFLAQLNVDAAIKLKDSFLNALRSLQEMPNRFPFLESKYFKRGKYRKMLVEKRYLIIFQLNDKTVFVDYIVDCKENYQWFIR